MIPLVFFSPSIVNSTRWKRTLGMGRRLTVVSVVSLSLILLTALVLGTRRGRYGISQSYKPRGVAHHRKSNSTLPASVRKHRTHLKNVEKFLIVIQYPVVDDNITILLNSHPNVAISNNLQLLDRVAKFICDESHGSLSLKAGDAVSYDGILHGLLAEEPLSEVFKQKKVKVIGDSVGLTLLQKNVFHLCLKKLSSTLRVPVSLLLVNTALLDERSSEPNTTEYFHSNIVKAVNASVLSLKWYHLSPRLFLIEVCSFLELSCTQDYLDLICES